MPPDAPAPVRTVATALDLPRCHLAESPRWSGSAWWWLDATDGRVWTLDDLGRAEGTLPPVWSLGRRTSLVQPIPGGVLLVSELDVGRWDGRRLTFGPALDVAPGTLVNDGTVDAEGRLLIGTIAPEWRAGAGLVVRRGLDGDDVVVLEGFTLSNGMAWTSDGALLHADSLERVVWRHDPVDGGWSSRPFLRLAESDGLPDGLAIDGEDGLWMAVYGAGEVRRHDSTGRLTDVVEVGTPQVTSVALGGADGRDLLITTAREGHDKECSQAEPAAGMLFRARARTTLYSIS